MLNYSSLLQALVPLGEVTYRGLKGLVSIPLPFIFLFFSWGQMLKTRQ